MEKAKLFFSTKTREFIANAYASHIKWDVWEKISEGFECKTIAEFYKECSTEELLEITKWTHTIYGKEICDLVDQAIDDAIAQEETDLGNVNWILIHESYASPGTLWATLTLDDPYQKEKRRIYKMRKNSIHN